MENCLIQGTVILSAYETPAFNRKIERKKIRLNLRPNTSASYDLIRFEKDNTD